MSHLGEVGLSLKFQGTKPKRLIRKLKITEKVKGLAQLRQILRYLGAKQSKMNQHRSLDITVKENWQETLGDHGIEQPRMEQHWSVEHGEDQHLGLKICLDLMYRLSY